MSPAHTDHGPSVRVRIAPSPTGSIHIGTARTALFNWLFARKHGGVFVLRIEDTDKERSKPEFEEQIPEALKWLGMEWDEGPHRQSERTDIYAGHLRNLLDAKKAYYCYCTKDELEAQKQSMLADGLVPKYSGHCRNLAEAPAGRKAETIRIKTPETTIEFKDMIRGMVKFDTVLLGDFVIAKDLETPLYNFAVVVDDEDMRITHVIRGEDHISNTPKQIVLQKALGFGTPHYAHLPLILAKDRSKLSKRYAETSLLEYRDKGYLPQAVVNFLVLMGWHPSPDPQTKEEKEVWTLEELIKEFDIDRVQKGGAVFNDEKLQWLNREHIKKLSTDELEEALRPFIEAHGLKIDSRERLHEVIEAVRERMRTLVDFFDLADFFFTLPEYAPALLTWAKAPEGESKGILTAARERLEGLKIWDKDGITSALEPLTAERGKGNVLWPVRVALSGRESSPDPFTIAAALGQEETIKRLSHAISIL